MTPSPLLPGLTADLYDAHVLKNYNRSALTLVRGRGAEVWDDTGRGYLDFTSGIAVCSLGHCHPDWVAAVQRQAAELVHVSNLFRNAPQGELARRLTARAGPGRAFFCNSGAEANEALIKLARLHGVRHLRRHERDAAGKDPEGLPPAGAGLRLRGVEQPRLVRGVGG